MSWLSGQELEEIIETYGNKSIKKAFLGVFAIDTLPKRIPFLPILLIINTQTLNLPGQHWKAVYISEQKFGEVFDSLALPVSLRLQSWMNTFSRKWIRSPLTLQNPLSPTCGIYTLYYVLKRLDFPNMKSCMEIFSKDLVKNDSVMRKFYDLLKK